MASSRVDAGRGRGSGPVKKQSDKNMKQFYIAIGLLAVAGVGTLAFLSNDGEACSPGDGFG